MSVPSMFNSGDSRCLQDVMKLVSSIKTYDYLEIGSWLGASLQWHLTNDRCNSVLSVDLRPIGVIEDERNINFEYTVTTQDMLQALHTNSLPIDKLTCIDGTVDQLPTDKKFDLVFIDAEHTNHAVYYDATHCLPAMNESCIMLFHDAWIVYEGLEKFNDYLNSTNRPFAGVKISGSDIYGIALGEMIGPFVEYATQYAENWDEFKKSAGERLGRKNK